MMTDKSGLCRTVPLGGRVPAIDSAIWQPTRVANIKFHAAVQETT